MSTPSPRFLLLAVWFCSLASGEVMVGDGVNGHSFRRYSTTDALNRQIHFFLSDAAADEAALPVVVFVQGTGCSSHFLGAATKILAGLPSLFHKVVGNRARVLAVEKPGVEYLDDQGDRLMQERCRPEFAHEHTLERWTEAIVAAIRASRGVGA